MPSKYQKGFTLVEMLVVMSIISTLSSIVLGAVNTARQKASNKQALGIVNEYRNAIELYRMNDPSGGLPNTGDATYSYCLGGSGGCYSRNLTQGYSLLNPGNPSLQAALSPDYFPTLPTIKPAPYVPVPGGDTWSIDGPQYTCNTLTGGICKKATMTWMYGNQDTNCLGGSATPFGTATFCSYTFE